MMMDGSRYLVARKIKPPRSPGVHAGLLRILNSVRKSNKNSRYFLESTEFKTLSMHEVLTSVLE